ncbi:M1 family metallopeptidase [Limnoraphis robusta Tam1]|uniref:M1 family metallopeptidase n=1 Tax=Limnoraphis robusta TaxID=1118279 RepID=UPI002B21DD70|nr:M1 family metallopeptidase [Limnoraphis robusta]MEA5542260.1 M1 family metallopeptidase [Limnoraphis robusta Tam1]
MLHSYFDTETDSQKSFELPGARPHYNPDRPGQVEHIFLDLVLDIPNQSFHGNCTINLKPVQSGIETLRLDAVNLEIQAVKIDQVDQSFDYDGEQLDIYLSQPTQADQLIKIAIAYHVDHPQRGLYFISPNADYPDKPTQVWTQGEDEDSRFWFPCFDYPGQLATSEIRVQVPQPFIAISNGELINSEIQGEKIIYHWLQKQIHPTYLMTLAVGEFAEIKDEWNNIPVLYYVEKNREADAHRSMGKTPQMMEFFSQTFGYAYPYPKYAQVCVDDFIFGGMENTSTTLLTDRCLLDEKAAIDNRSTESLVAHELAHQWFGDLVVIEHWSHAWIKEGMATYSEVLWTEHEYGKEEAAYYRLAETRNYLSEDRSRYRRPIVTHIYREAIELYDRHLYEKGACVYHMIRTELGDELFTKAIHTFVQNNAHKTVETFDLLRSIQQSTGRNLLFLFDQYVYRGGHPDYKVSYSWDGENKLAKITVKQKQAKTSDKISETNLFDLKIPIAFGYLPKSSQDETTPPFQTFTVRIHEAEQSFYFPLSEKPKYISFDAGNNTLKTVSLEYPVAELKAQLQFDPDPISRIFSAEALARKGGLEVVKTLSKALKDEPFWGVRVEIAKQLNKIKLDQAFAGLIVGLEDSNSRVRQAVVNALAKIKIPASYQALKSIVEKGDVSYSVEASAITAIGEMVAGNPDEALTEENGIKLLELVLQERMGWNEVLRSAAISGLSRMKTSEPALNLILSYSVPTVPQALRLAAIRALGSISTGQNNINLERILQRLEELSKEEFFLTQVAVVVALEQMETPKAIAVLNDLADQTLDGRVRRKAEEAVQKVQKNIGSDKAVKQLREELDKVKRDNQELRSRLESLEAKTQANSKAKSNGKS